MEGLSPGQIGKRIVRLRKLKGYSQADLGRFLDIPRSSVAQIELGNRNITVVELMKLSEVLGFSLDKFLSREYDTERPMEMVEEAVPAREEIRVSVPQLNIKKLQNILLYVLERCAGKPNIGETVLNKLYDRPSVTE